MQVLEYRGWGPDNEEKARHQEVQQQRFDELSKIYDKKSPGRRVNGGWADYQAEFGK